MNPPSGPPTPTVSGPPRSRRNDPDPQNFQLIIFNAQYAGIHFETTPDFTSRRTDLRRHQPLRQPHPGRRRPRRGVAGHRGDLFVQGQRLHRPSPHGGAHRTAPRQDRGRRRGNPDGFRLLDSAPQSLRHRHPHAAGAAHRAEHDDENDDRRQAPGRHRPDRRRHRSRDAGAGVGRQL